jgi:hypothetical protein
LAKHRKPERVEDSNAITDILAIEVPLPEPEPPKPEPSRPPARSQSPRFEPMFRGFGDTNPLPRASPLAADRDPEPPPPGLGRRSRGMALVIALIVLAAMTALIIAVVILITDTHYRDDGPPKLTPITTTGGP